LTVAGRLAVGNTERAQHLFRRQAQQFTRRRCPEDAHRRRAVPAAVHRTGECDAARHVQTQRHGQKQLLAANVTKAVSDSQHRTQYRDARMDRAAGVERVVEVERVPHAGVEQRGLRARQAHAPQQHAAFRQSAPSRNNREGFADPGRTTAAEHAPECVEEVAAGRRYGALRQIRVARTADVRGESRRWIIGHDVHPKMAAHAAVSSSPPRQ